MITHKILQYTFSILGVISLGFFIIRCLKVNQENLIINQSNIPRIFHDIILKVLSRNEDV
ncbi:hypothetical protein KDJ21_015525 [Metabacillus litoralis]|uniref:hypothetical protein n=1 Tax=Metabacillus litoralis TaxID=152268 RepID=UPI001E41D515|nr:hypothetical protein [Metabacillus litoralis]UHA58270.1 hypothetical protein KDJ21_015525 [Metabacillus litoralis]